MGNEHLVNLIRDRVARHGDRVAMRYRQDDGWADISWRDVGAQMTAVASALLELGVPEGGRVAIFSQNRPEWTIADLAVQSIRGVTVPIYPTNTARQAEFILEHAGVAVVFAGTQDQVAKLEAIASPTRPLTVVVLDPAATLPAGGMHFADLLALGERAGRGAEVDARLATAEPSDLATIIYTSGTTGEPKGVMLTQANFLAAYPPHDERLLDPNENDISLAFLPLSHVFERCWTFYALTRGMTNCYLDDPTKVVEALQAVRPTVMCAVPRFYEKVYSAVHARVQTAPPLRRKLFAWAVAAGREMSPYRKDGRRAPLALRARHALADRLVLAKLRGIVGGRVKFFPCAGAPLSQEIEEFFHACGLYVCYGYGLTETTATVTCHEHRGFTFGTVGKPLRGIEVKIGEENEILVKAPTVMSGYYKNPAATAEVFTADGFFRTGDAGALTPDGCLVITDRLKDLIKTSGGKYIAPQLIEAKLGADPFLEQVAVVGDMRRYVCALLVPAFPVLEEHARALGIPFASREELVRRPEVLALYQERVDRTNAELARYEQVKRFTLLTREFTVEGGEITPTMKVKRRGVAEKYRAEIDAMYADSVASSLA